MADKFEEIRQNFINTEASEPPEVLDDEEVEKTETGTRKDGNEAAPPAFKEPKPKSEALLKLENWALFNALCTADRAIGGIHAITFNMIYAGEKQVTWADARLTREQIEDFMQTLPEDAKEYLRELFPPWLNILLNAEGLYLERLEANAKPVIKKVDDKK